MKATGVVRRIDDLGRIVIPKEIRRNMRIKEGDSLEIYVDSGDTLILKKYSPVQNVNDFVVEFVESIFFSTKKDIVVTDNEKIIAQAGNFKKDIVGKKISIRLEEKISKRNTQIISKSEKIELCDNYEFTNNAILKPINVFGDIIGCVIVFSDNEIGDIEKSLVEFGGLFMSRYLEG